MTSTKRARWIGAAIFAAVLATGTGTAQKSPPSDVLYQRAVQKEKIDGDTKAAIDLYKQVVAAPGVSQQLRIKALDRLAALVGQSAGTLTDRLICSGECPGPRALVSITAEGRYLAFTNNDALEIWDTVTGKVIRPAGAKNLTYAPWPLLSPDGQQVVYASTERDANGGVIKQSLQTIRTEDNGTPRTLVDNPEYHDFIPGAWAQSGKKLLVAVSKPDRTWFLAWVSIEDRKVQPIKSLGWRYTPIMGRPTLSPDGRYIAYSALAVAPASPDRGNSPNQRDTHVYALPIDEASPEIELVTGASINEAPVWMPDNRTILFVTDRSGPFGLWSAALNGIKPVPVKAGTGRINSAGMTTSGSYYYVSQQAQVAQFWIANLNGNKPQDVNRSTPDSIIGVSPVWSPNGKQIAFKRQTLRGSSELVDTLFVRSIDSPDERRYNASNSTLSPVDKPLWLHNGKALLQLMRNAGGDRSLFRVDLSTVDVKGAEFKELTTTVDSAPLAISSDDKTVYFLIRGTNPSTGGSRMDRIVAIDIDSREQRNVSTVSEPDMMILSRDDKTLYLTSCANRKCDRIVAVDTATGQQRQILKLQDPEVLYGPRLALSPDGQRLVAVSGIAEKSQTLPLSLQLFEIGVDGKGYRKLAGTNSQPGMLVWSTDGTIIAPSNSGLIRISANGNTEILKSLMSSDVTVSPDGLQMAVATRTDPVNVLHALDNVATYLRTAK